MAASNQHNSPITSQLRSYKRKYYLNKLARGSIFFAAISLTVYLLFNSLEYTVRLNSYWRAALFFSFLALVVVLLFYLVIDPLIKLSNNKRQISDEEAARQIGTYFPEINDKLLNVLQLQYSSPLQSPLIGASIVQKTQQLSVFSFPLAIDLRGNLRFLRYLIIPVLIIVLVALLLPQLLVDGTSRIVHFQKDYAVPPPFTFDIKNNTFTAFRNEDFTVDVATKGNTIPDKVFLHTGDRRLRMSSIQPASYQHKLPSMQQDMDFYIEAAGYQSSSYKIKVVDRPNLKNFNIALDYPKYLNKKDVRLSNSGNLQVPEGTNITWLFGALATDSAWIKFPEEDTSLMLAKSGEQSFSIAKTAKRSGAYQLRLQNQYSSNKQDIAYFMEVIPDQHPEITLEQMQDTVLYKFLVLGGNLSDDYGLSNLALYYKLEQPDDNTKEDDYRRVDIGINKNQNKQSYYYQWQLDSANLKPGDQIRYFLRVWDNDGVNGHKSSKTATYTFSIPDQKAIQENLAKSAAQTQSEIGKNVQKATELSKQIEDAQQKLKGKKELNWQDKQMLEDLLKKREEVEKALKELKEQSQNNNLKQDEFSESDKRIQEQIKQLQSLVDELLDDETKKLYEELQKLLEEKSDINKIQENLSDLSKKEENLEQELERTLELFKRMKLNQDMDALKEQLSQAAEEQQKLADETEDKNKSLDELSEDQKQQNKDFEDIQKELDKIEQSNQDLKNPMSLQDMTEEQKTIQQEQQKAQDALDKNKRDKAQQSQQKSAQQMQQMAQKLQQMQQSMQMEQTQEDMDNLRAILDNLMTLSFDQEGVMKSFREVKQNDPRFIDLSQQQLKLRDDAQIIEDSLLALAERVFQIQSFVTREVKDMNQYMDESMAALRERQQYQAISKQQFSMTSINNLALLLNDVLSQMQQQMASAMGNPQEKQGNSRPNMNLGDMQKQLSQQISELKQSGKSGRQLSEELAKLAAQQEKIRQALQKMQQMQDMNNKKGGKQGTGGDDLIKQMEETESDLVNKRLTSETIKRQKEITSRLLEVEKSMREQEMDKERKGETAKDDYDKQVIKSFDQYIQTKKQEIELLKTVPVKLNPYFKNEANEYLKRIN